MYGDVPDDDRGARQQRVHKAAADRVGVERGAKFLGCSVIAGTNGWPLGPVAGPEEETILTADVDLSAARSAPVWSKLNDLLRDRRTDLYDGMLGYRPNDGSRRSYRSFQCRQQWCSAVAKQLGVGKESVRRCLNSTGRIMAKSPVEAFFVVRAWCPGPPQCV